MSAGLYVCYKAKLAEFIRAFYPNVSGVQQAKHLNKQGRFYIISGTMGDMKQKIPVGYYHLITLEKPHSAFKSDNKRRN